MVKTAMREAFERVQVPTGKPYQQTPLVKVIVRSMNKGNGVTSPRYIRGQ